MGIITLLGELTDESYAEFLENFLELEASEKRVAVYLNSVGGSVRVALNLYDIIKSSKLNVDGVVIGTCYSAANIVLQACTKRFALPNASFMLHAGSSSLEETPYTEFPAAYRLDKYEMAIADKLVFERASDLPKLKRLYKKGEYFAPEMAKQLGLIDATISLRA